MLSSPIIIHLVNDMIFEDVEFFQARIVVTSDRLKVRFGPQDAIKVFITDDDCESETYSILSVCLESHCLDNVEWRSQIVLSIIIMLACNLIAIVVVICRSCMHVLQYHSGYSHYRQFVPFVSSFHKHYIILYKYKFLQSAQKHA